VLILVSGPVGSGKTTLCQRLVDAARRRGFCVGGVLTPPVMEAGVKVGIEAVDLGTGETRLLACNGRDLKGTQVGPYSFDDQTLEWVAARCAESLTESPASTGETLVFVDEMGRLELNRGAGLARLIPLLVQSRDRHVVVIVRDTLLDRLMARVQEGEPRVVVLNPQRRETAWTELADLVVKGRSDR
jgi:nucleoside-triphosphatase THEP1